MERAGVSARVEDKTSRDILHISTASRRCLRFHGAATPATPPCGRGTEINVSYCFRQWQKHDSPWQARRARWPVHPRRTRRPLHPRPPRPPRRVPRVPRPPRRSGRRRHDRRYLPQELGCQLRAVTAYQAVLILHT